MNYTLQQATEADREYAVFLHKRCYHDVVVAQFGSWDDQIQRGFFEKEWNPLKYQIIVVDGIPMGIISIDRNLKHISLLEIRIDPLYQNKKLGTHILHDLCSEAVAKHLPIRLQTLRKNRARSLYLRLGFHQISETDTHIILEKNNIQP